MLLPEDKWLSAKEAIQYGIIDKIKSHTNYLEYPDVNIQYACNLACVGCISLSDFDRRGGVRINEGKQWLQDWSKKSLGTICLFGGELFKS